MTEALARRFKRCLVTGFLITTPLGVSFLVLSWLVKTVDALLAPATAALLGRHVPGLGLFAAILLFLGAGALGSNMEGRHLLEVFEDLLLRIPVFNWLYRTSKQVIEVFSPGGKVQFQGVVLIEYPRPKVYSLGFVTKTMTLQRDSGSEELLCVYVPTNHLYIGDVVLVPQTQATMLGLSLQEAVQSIISAGASVPDALRAAATDQNKRSGT